MRCRGLELSWDWEMRRPLSSFVLHLRQTNRVPPCGRKTGRASVWLLHTAPPGAGLCPASLPRCPPAGVPPPRLGRHLPRPTSTPRTTTRGRGPRVPAAASCPLRSPRPMAWKSADCRNSLRRGPSAALVLPAPKPVRRGRTPLGVGPRRWLRVFYTPLPVDRACSMDGMRIWWAALCGAAHEEHGGFRTARHGASSFSALCGAR
ncbi:hypothetical protein DFH09DRAFT_65677 [Mycena vulgaris]|nr:hypothetical protein DFH09DRAFT_65677 [Mycena vulgaris]